MNKRKSIERAENLLDDLSIEVDIICLPELALIGYQFESKQEIEPFCEIVPANFKEACEDTQEE